MTEFVNWDIPICENLDDSTRDYWVDALRSGNYIQGGADLRREASDVDGGVEYHYCCLGVLADTVNDDWRESTENCLSFQSHLTEGTSFLDSQFAGVIHLEYSDQRMLASMNDAGVDFLDIADMIENRRISFHEDGTLELRHSKDLNAIAADCNKDVLDGIRSEEMVG